MLMVVAIKFRAELPFILFLLLAVFGYLMPATAWFSSIPGDLGDSRFNSFILEHFYAWLVGAAESLWSPMFFYPFEDALAFSDNLFGSAPIYALFRLVGFGREGGYLGWFVCGALLNYVFTYYALQRLCFSKFSSAFCGFVFGFALPALVLESHAQLMYRFAIPLAVSEIGVLIRDGHSRSVARTAFFVALQFYFSIYLGVFLVALVVAIFVSLLLIYWFKWRGLEGGCFYVFRQMSWREIAVVVSSLLAVVVLLGKYMLVARAYGFSRSPADVISMLPTMGSYLIQDFSSLYSFLGESIFVEMRQEHQLFVGAGVVFFAFFGAWVAVRDRVVIGGVCILVLAIVFFATLRVGDFSIYKMFLYLPGVSSVRAVSRIILVVLFPLGALGAIGIDRCSCFLSSRGWGWLKYVVFCFVFVVLSAETFTYSSYTTPVSEWLVRKERILNVLPNVWPNSPVLYVQTAGGASWYLDELDGMIVAQDLRLPTLNGYSGNFPPGYLLVGEDVRNCLSPQNRIDAYREHAALAPGFEALMLERLVVVPSLACGVVRRVVPSVAAAFVAKASLSQEIGGPWLHAEFENRSERPLAFPANSPLRMSWRFIPASASSEEIGWLPRHDLPLIVGAGDRIKADVKIDMPSANGEYRLEVTLVQEGVAWFDDLGMKVGGVSVNVSRE
ncbi:hypothetical protein [Uliginosibacterium aquaticum]|uniref:YfhO family protein n=1 Tax=Uliginosibacterium aquaticum TaxID=2731212 RepID=A0ABX2IBG1_9RHOO|nr:hypothetical protein [Uliginosibacterium aquaticum]NSL53765.1 hypothetical protein [Uliginosibacterium aquaticum]